MNIEKVNVANQGVFYDSEKDELLVDINKFCNNIINAFYDGWRKKKIQRSIKIQCKIC